MIRTIFQWIVAVCAIGLLAAGVAGNDAGLIAGSVLVAAMIVADAIQRARPT